MNTAAGTGFNSKRKPWILALLAAALSALPYITGLQHGFVFDDHGVIVENGFLNQRNAWFRALTLRTMFDRRIVDSGRPAVILTYLADRAIWGARPFGYHLTNVIGHVCVVVLVFFGAHSLLRTVPPRAPHAPAFTTFAAAILFGLHPALAEAVQIPAFREDILVTAGLLAYLTTSPHHPYAALLWLIPALAAKESGTVALPLLAWFWLCFSAHRPPPRRMLITAASTAAVSLAFLATWFYTKTFQALSVPNTPPPLPFPTNLWTFPWLWARALRFLIWPHPLRLEHLIEPVPSPADPRFILGMFLLAVVVSTAVRMRHKQPFFAFACGWSVIAFIPVSNLVPLHNAFAERYLYLIAIGFCAALATLIGRVAAKTPRSLLLAGLCSIYAALTLSQIRTMQNDFALWTRALAYEPKSARAWVWTGLELKRAGLRDEARQHFQRALVLKPDDASATVNLAILNAEDGDLAAAEKLLRDALKHEPHKADIWWNLGVCLHALQRDDEATAAIHNALECDPFFEPARRALEQRHRADPRFFQSLEN